MADPDFKVWQCRTCGYIYEEALGLLAEQVPNMICSSADLSNSDKTEGFLNKTHAFAKGDWTVAHTQASRALGKLPQGSPAALRARDIVDYVPPDKQR